MHTVHTDTYTVGHPQYRTSGKLQATTFHRDVKHTKAVMCCVIVSLVTHDMTLHFRVHCHRIFNKPVFPWRNETKCSMWQPAHLQFDWAQCKWMENWMRFGDGAGTSHSFVVSSLVWQLNLFDDVAENITESFWSLTPHCENRKPFTDLWMDAPTSSADTRWIWENHFFSSVSSATFR